MIGLNSVPNVYYAMIKLPEDLVSSIILDPHRSRNESLCSFQKSVPPIVKVKEWTCEPQEEGASHS
jgi:hypothetical protein